MTLRSLAALLLLSASATPVIAQDVGQIDKRVGTLESQMKAVQKKVFPGGNSKYFEPEIVPAQPAPEPAGIPATSPITDLTTRVDALERQLATVTGQAEQANFRAQQAEQALAKFRAETEYRLTQLEGGGTAAAPAPAAAETVAPPVPKPVAPTPKPAVAGAKPATTAPKPVAKPPVAVAAADAATTDAPVTAVPADPVEAEFQAAYSLYQNKRYTEAEAALTTFVAKRPKSKRASHAQYWLGRAYLSDKQPAPAAKAFLDNYRNMPKGERAPDSLLWLGQSLMAMTPPNAAKACEVYDEMNSAYATKLTPVLTTQLAKARAAAKCSS